ncbi:MAG: cell wall hydrolase [Candidatus Taylorbacteria bacterium]|nr:cell wall hydrolase [Candidatus Taylorbacteria bacterium]
MKHIKGVLAAAAIIAAAASAGAFVKGAHAQYMSVTLASQPQFTLLADNMNLTTGSSNNDVVQLQGILSELGYLNVPATVQLGYFGPMTKAALAQYQASINVPSTGYFGPMTRQGMTNDFAARGWLSLLYGTSTNATR